MTHTFVDIVHRWAFEHYPLEILPRIEMKLVLDHNDIPRELILERALRGLAYEEMYEAMRKPHHRIRFDIASPTFFQDLEDLLFRIWGLRACKRPFRTHDQCGCEDVRT